MRALVTGGCGFIGSHLCGLLLADGHQVVVIDNMCSGKIDNVAEFENSKHFRFIQADITDYDAIKRYFASVDWVFHLAGMADIVPSIENPKSYFDTNVAGTLNVLRASHAAGVKRLVYAASSSCYGIPIEYPTPERAQPDPRYPYALTKYLGEQLVLHWDQVYRLPSVSLRLFNVYGPRSRTTGTYGAVFGVFLSQKLHGKPFTVVGNGEQARDFTFVSDVVRAFVQAAQSRISGQVFNVGSGAPKSINYLVSLLDGPVEFIPKRPGEPDLTFADIGKIQKVLGWKPSVSFEDGVALMLEAIDSWKEAPVWDPEKIRKATETWFKYLDEKNLEGLK